MIEQIKKEFAKTLNYLLRNEKFEDTPKIFQPEEISISERVVGGKVELVNGDGTLAPMPDGDYELSDGFKFSVKDGLISSIDGEEPVEASEDMSEESPTETTTDDSDIKASLESLKQLTEELKAEVDTMKSALDELKAANSDTASKDEVAGFSKQISDLNETIRKVANIPAEFSKTTKSNIAKDANEEGKKRLSDFFKNMN